MAKQTVNIGTTSNDRTGDSLRSAFNKINANFTELYTELGLVDGTDLNLGAFEFTGSTMTTTDSSEITIAQAVNISSSLTVSGEFTLNGQEDSSQPLNSEDPAGYLEITIDGQVVYLPYYT